MPVRKTKKLVYEATRVAVKPLDVVESRTIGQVTVKNVNANRKKSSEGKITLQLADGRIVAHHPGEINAIWI